MTELIRIVWDLLYVSGVYILVGVVLVTVMALALRRLNSSVDPH